MPTIDERIVTALKNLPEKPPAEAKQKEKKRYSEKISAALALAFADELRARGLRDARPALPGDVGGSGAERRLAGGIGAKKVDVSWTTETSGLVLGISIKSINWRDARTNNFQKNLINRRGDMLIESVTLHRRFPYAVLAGFFFLDKEAKTDNTTKRRATFENAHNRLRIFTGRDDPAGRDEQLERLYLVSMDANPFEPKIETYLVGKPGEELTLGSVIDELVKLVAERNPDFYEYFNGKLRRAR